MAKALWVYMVTGEFGLPTIYKPSIAVRELRKLFTYYNLLNRQIRMIKNGIQALLTENGINLEEAERKLLLKKNGDSKVIQKFDLTSASILIITGELVLLRNLLERKEKLTEDILLAGVGFQKQVETAYHNPRHNAAGQLGIPGGLRRYQPIFIDTENERLPWVGTAMLGFRRQGETRPYQ